MLGPKLQSRPSKSDREQNDRHEDIGGADDVCV